MSDYKTLFEEKETQFEELNEQFLLYQGTTFPTQKKPTT